MTAKKNAGASEAPRARSESRSEAVRAALVRKRAGVVAEWHPCLWCGGAIPEQRVKDAMLRNLEPKYCCEPCRRNEPARSLVARIYAGALGASKSDENVWRLDYETRLAAALRASTPPAKKGGRK